MSLYIFDMDGVIYRGQRGVSLWLRASSIGDRLETDILPGKRAGMT